MDTVNVNHRTNPLRLALLVTLCLICVGCSSPRLIDRRTPAWAKDLGAQQPKETTVKGTAPDGQQPTATPPPQRTDAAFYRAGTGELIGAPSSIADAAMDDGEIKLNFQNANLLEVVKVVLGDMLGATYVIDPRVQGAVTMQTSRPLTRSDLIPTLELLLRMNEAALVMDGDIFRVMPIANAVTGVRAPQLGDSSLPLPRGYSVRVVPLKYVAAEEMAQILEPFIAGGNNMLRTDSKRNAIILAGNAEEMARLIETIRVFDIDRMRGMSVAMFTPDFVDAKTLGEELEVVLTDPDYGLMAGLVRIVVIERLNGLMIITPRPEYLAQVRVWVRRLDRDSGGAGRRLFFYRVQNAKATDLAETLNQLFEPEQADRIPRPELAPGLTPTTLRSTTDNNGTVGEDQSSSPKAAPASASTIANEGLAVNSDSQVRVIADEPNNALLILATAQEYQQVLSALEQLDVVPMQVLIDVTIAEVTLNDNLQFGVEWFFKNRFGSDTGTAQLDLGDPGLFALTPGFSYAFRSGGDVRAVLNMLATESNLSILSTPSLLVLNNQEASIEVGDEVPITTRQQQATESSDANIINEIEYRKTGVLLQVKPRVNAGGLVIMEVEQEDSRAPQLEDQEETLTPRIQQRKVKSTVAVQSGDTIILGGLIRDNREQSESGIPGLHKLPIFGALFGAKGDLQQRTELLVLITPRAILDRNSALQVTEEFRRKLNSLIPIDPGNETNSEPSASKPQIIPPDQPPAPRASPTPAEQPPERQSALPASDPEEPAGETTTSIAGDRIGPFIPLVALGDYCRYYPDFKALDLRKTLRERESAYRHQVTTSA